MHTSLTVTVIVSQTINSDKINFNIFSQLKFSWIMGNRNVKERDIMIKSVPTVRKFSGFKYNDNFETALRKDEKRDVRE